MNDGLRKLLEDHMASCPYCAPDVYCIDAMEILAKNLNGGR